MGIGEDICVTVLQNKFWMGDDAQWQSWMNGGTSFEGEGGSFPEADAGDKIANGRSNESIPGKSHEAQLLQPAGDWLLAERSTLKRLNPAYCFYVSSYI